ncbi:MAG: methyltransferase [Thermodesulfobacteriota bacterium]
MEHPMGLLEEVRGFMKSRIILTGVELDLFTQVQRGVDTAEGLAKQNGLDLRALRRLMDAVVTYGLLDKQGGRYALTPEAAFLSADHPESTLPMMLHMNELWNNWSGLTAVVTTGKNLQPVSVSKKTEKNRKAFIGAMHVVGRHLSREIAGALDLSPYRKMVDIGGSSGTYTIAFLQRNPAMKAVIFDLEPVIPLAEERIRSAGMLDRVELAAGNYYTDPLPEGCDLALLSAIIHQNSPDQNRELYGKIHAALVPGGTLMIRDHIMDENRTVPPGGAVFALNMLVGTQGGDTYTFREISGDLEAAGFSDVRQIRSGEKMDGIVTARKP